MNLNKLAVNQKSIEFYEDSAALSTLHSDSLISNPEIESIFVKSVFSSQPLGQGFGKLLVHRLMQSFGFQDG